MTKSLYFSINFVTLHQKNPGFNPGNNAGNPYLTIGGLDTHVRRYSLAFGYGDPGESPNADSFDYPEFATSYATFVRPAVYGVRGTYTAERPNGGSTAIGYQVWHTMAVPDDFILPAEFLSPNATDVMASYLDEAREQVIKWAKAEGWPLANLVDKFNSAQGLFSTMETHMTRQFQLVNDALAGRIDANMLMQLSDQAAMDFGLDLAGSAVGLPAPVVLLLKSLVATHVVTAKAAEDYVQVGIKSGAGAGFVPPVPTSHREVGSLQSDELFDPSTTTRDVVIGGPGNDIVHANAGSDILVGGLGIDTLDYSVDTDLDVSLVRNTAVGVGFTDRLAGFENVTGGRGSNRIEGSNGANLLDGSRGAQNVMTGLAGDDILVGGKGSDRLDGGDGSDTASYYRGIFDPIRFTYTGLVLSLENPAANTGDAKGDTWTSIESVSGTDIHDLIVGDANSNRLLGHQGNDRIFARAGNDTLEGGEGADRLDGGTGTDVASYVTASAGVTANFLTPALNRGDAAGDTFYFVESLVGSRHGDLLYGNNGVNAILGSGGNDLLVGYAGNDTLYGATGTDRIYGGAGADRFLFKSLADSPTGTTDTIFEFNGAAGDRIELITIDANTNLAGNQAFTFIGAAAFRGVAGDLRYVKAASDTYIYGDVNGDRTVDLRIHLDDALTLSRGYFLL